MTGSIKVLYHLLANQIKNDALQFELSTGSSAVYLKLITGKGLAWHAQGLLRLYLLCDNGDVAGERIQPGLHLNFKSIKMHLFRNEVLFMVNKLSLPVAINQSSK